MKSKKGLFVERQSLIFAAAILVIGLSVTNYCTAGNIAVLVQQTPANGGSVTPGIGVHEIGTNSQIALTAVPKPGYQFVYWLGDVADPTANNTTAYADNPKIIIAVFAGAI